MPERLTYFLRVRQWSQRKLAQELRVSDASVSEWVNGKSSPTLKMLGRICQAIGITEAVFFGDIQNDSDEPPATA